MTARTRELPIWTAREHDSRAVGESLGAAFFHEPVTGWLVPDQADRARIMPRFFGLVAQEAQRSGTVHVVGDHEATALWFDLAPGDAPGEVPDAPDPYAAVMGPYADRWTTLAEIMDSSHPAEPHHYLMLIGVLPHLQGAGIGSLLLEHHHALLAPRALPAYLEATSPQSRRLYLRHGYQDVGDPLRLPDGPQLWPMWRPAPAGTAG